MLWLKANLGTIAVVLVILVIVALIVRNIVKDKKAGRSTCGSNCAHCQMAGQCHQTENHQ